MADIESEVIVVTTVVVIINNSASPETRIGDPLGDSDPDQIRQNSISSAAERGEIAITHQFLPEQRPTRDEETASLPRY